MPARPYFAFRLARVAVGAQVAAPVKQAKRHETEAANSATHARKGRALLEAATPYSVRS